MPVPASAPLRLERVLRGSRFARVQLHWSYLWWDFYLACDRLALHWRTCSTSRPFAVGAGAGGRLQPWPWRWVGFRPCMRWCCWRRDTANAPSVPRHFLHLSHLSFRFFRNFRTWVDGPWTSLSTAFFFARGGSTTSSFGHVSSFPLVLACVPCLSSLSCVGVAMDGSSAWRVSAASTAHETFPWIEPPFLPGGRGGAEVHFSNRCERPLKCDRTRRRSIGRKGGVQKGVEGESVGRSGPSAKRIVGTDRGEPLRGWVDEGIEERTVGCG